MRIELRPLDSITPYDKNPRANDGAVEAVARSLKEFGWRQPCVVDKDGVLVVGHTRWKAAKLLGMTEVPVHVAHELTPEQARAYRIADNQTATIAEWDTDLLEGELAALKDLGVEDTWNRVLTGGEAVGPTSIPIYQTPQTTTSMTGVHLLALDGIADFAISSRGGRCATIARFAHSGATLSGVLDNFTVFSANGRRVIQGNLLPNTSTERWLDFTHVAVNEASGSRKAMFFSAETVQDDPPQTPAPRRFVIFRNSSLVMASGSSVGGVTLSGPVQSLATNMNADYAAVWGIANGTAQALVMDGTVVLKTGDPVLIEDLGPGHDPITGTIASLVTPIGIALGPRHSGMLTSFVLASVNSDNLPDAPVLDVLFRVDLQVGEAVACPVDFNADGILGTQDIFDFLNAWFIGCIGPPTAELTGCTKYGRVLNTDFNGSGTLDVQDIFDYLNAWFAGCD